MQIHFFLPDLTASFKPRKQALPVRKVFRDDSSFALRTWWKDFSFEVIRHLNSRGHRVELSILPPQEITTERVAATGAEFVFIPHLTKNDLPNLAVPALFYMQVMQRWLFSLDKDGWGADSSAYPCTAYRDVSADPECFDAYRKLLISGNASKMPQPRRQPYWLAKLRGKLPTKPYILFPCQLPHDYNVRRFCHVTEEALVSALVAWSNETKTTVAFKPHPASPAAMEPLRALTHGAYVHWLDNISIHDAIHHSAAVYVMNSGVGMEAMLHEKPIVTFGRAEYDVATVAGNIHALDDAWQQARTLDMRHQSTEYRRFYHWFCRHYAIDLLEETRLDERLKIVLAEAGL